MVGKISCLGRCIPEISEANDRWNASFPKTCTKCRGGKASQGMAKVPQAGQRRAYPSTYSEHLEAVIHAFENELSWAGLLTSAVGDPDSACPDTELQGMRPPDLRRGAASCGLLWGGKGCFTVYKGNLAEGVGYCWVILSLGWQAGRQELQTAFRS
eukprot:1160428-Pelagomonas_calceolata.AAC.18